MTKSRRQSFDGLAGHPGNMLKILVYVQDTMTGQFCGGRDHQVWYRGRAMVSLLGQLELDL
ncbi:hypothetical protein D7316_03772 [Gordonia insulae]|uniref:Uncharacterized protein n=1 Tax=Gordonia insulae TaxID=2420509 RepID=A0A3G8JPX4_9ACTN|nr:hypothetical protein D7316_03772 [Gordonia insulae]